jgi:hypothetical protein
MSKYKIVLKREVINSSLHIVGGAFLAFILVPVYPIYVMILANLLFGSLREYFQYRRKKVQPLYIIIIDVMGWVIGGLIWFFVRNYFQINADIL